MRTGLAGAGEAVDVFDALYAGEPSEGACPFLFSGLTVLQGEPFAGSVEGTAEVGRLVGIAGGSYRFFDSVFGCGILDACDMAGGFRGDRRIREEIGARGYRHETATQVGARFGNSDEGAFFRLDGGCRRVLFVFVGRKAREGAWLAAAVGKGTRRGGEILGTGEETFEQVRFHVFIGLRSPAFRELVGHCHDERVACAGGGHVEEALALFIFAVGVGLLNGECPGAQVGRIFKREVVVGVGLATGAGGRM